MKLFDAHCHIYLSQFDADRAEVLAHMKDLDMGAIVVGTDYEESVQALELAKQHDFLWASVGLHPNDNVDEVFDVAKYEELARDPKVVAVGECGLDYYHTDGAGQKERFLQQIELAEKVQKPLIIHCRDAHDDLLAMFATKMPSVPVIIHFFTGSGELAQKYLALGCYLSFPGPITYTDMYDESVRLTPLDKLLIETDSPFAAPVPNRGKRNEPAYVLEVVKKIAVIKGISEEEVASAAVTNATQIFKLGK